MLTKRTLIIHMLKNLGYILGVVFIAGGISFFIATHIADIANGINESKKITATLERRNESLERLESDYAEVKPYEKDFRQALLPTSNILEFTGVLESLGQKYGLVQTFHFETPTDSGIAIGTPPQKINKIGFGITIQTNVTIGLAFIKELELLPYFAEISSISFAGTPEGWKKSVSINITGVLYTEDDTGTL